MMGAAASAFYINDAATLLPRAVVAKARTYIAGEAADVLEVRTLLKILMDSIDLVFYVILSHRLLFQVGVRTEGIQEALMKMPNIAENADRITKMKRVIKAVSEMDMLKLL